MKEIIGALKYRFYRQGITRRIIIVITALSVFSNMAFVGSVFVIIRHQLINRTISGSEKDVEMIAKELEMFFDGIRNDSVSVVVSEACQTLLSNLDELPEEDVKARYKRYKLVQTTIMSAVGQRSIFNTIVFYDRNGNSYTSDGLLVSDENKTVQTGRVKQFLSGTDNEEVLAIHKSPWKKKKDTEFADCISYLRKVYNKESGQLIGAVEFEIPNSAICSLYLPVMADGNQIYLVYNDEIISSAAKSDLYKDLRETGWYRELNTMTEKASFKVLQKDGRIYLEKNSPELKWKIINSVPTSIYMKDIRFYAILDLTIGIFLLTANLYISNILIVSITKPLSKITGTIVNIGKGDYDCRVHVEDGGEIGILAEEFNRMVERTKALMAQIVEKEQEKRESELSLIQMQMTPHFFYNILESICGLIVMDEKKTAINTISLLSGFYRGVLNKGKEIITIKDELTIAENYLEIMKICHPDKFTYSINCPEKLYDGCINKLTLQPILENAIHHGFRQMSTGGIIRIDCYEEKDRTVLEIYDNGCGIPVSNLKEMGKDGNEGFHMESFGLRNTDERIKLYFGAGYGISIVREETGTRIRIILPSGRNYEAAE